VKELTDRQAQVLEYIVKYRQERGIPPTFREIARHFGISHQAVQRMLVFIRAKGLLTWTEGRARTLQAAI
jgi:SOS-response transcriptional repressor LexA